MCLFHLFQRRRLLLFILICWIYSVFKRILEEVGFICEGFRFRAVSKNVISTLTVLHLFLLVLDLFLVALVLRYELSTHSRAAFQGAAVASLENVMFSWNLSSASCLNLCPLPEPVTKVFLSCKPLWIPFVSERCGFFFFLSGQKSLTVTCWMPLQW